MSRGGSLGFHGRVDVVAEQETVVTFSGQQRGWGLRLWWESVTRA